MSDQGGTPQEHQEPYGTHPYGQYPHAGYGTEPTRLYPGAPYSGAPYPWAAAPPPPTLWPPHRTRGRRIRRTAVGVLAAAAIAAGGVAAGAELFGGGTTTAGHGTPVVPAVPGAPSQGGSGADTGTAVANAAQQVGVVDINTVLGYQNAQAAGTGMVLTADGRILTNNHVIDGATAIKVTVVSTGKRYTAKVVGTSPSKDIAVLQLDNASGLRTATLGNSNTVDVGETVVGVGNAGGSGGVPSAATGTVKALNQSITASGDRGQDTQHLTGLIETTAPIEPGDSGGPMYDTSNAVIAINTAASTRHGATVASYAIPINTARSIAGQIESGAETSTIHIGYPAFLGVSLSSNPARGALVTGVLRRGPADAAGITAGDTITAVGGHAVSSADSLRSVLAGYQPGQSVSVSWTGPDGTSHSATVTLIVGPAD
jgi:S1-C subfamily serine protease